MGEEDKLEWTASEEIMFLIFLKLDEEIDMTQLFCLLEQTKK